jgi:ribosomal protein L11 methyltransferase
MIGFSLFFVSLHRFLTSYMKYFEVNMTIEPCSQDAQDLLAALAGEAGFETFEETTDGLKGYVQQALFDEETLKSVLDVFPIDNTHISYNVREAEDRDWNEQWEQEGFEPIDVRCQMADGTSKTLLIHDGRHLPADTNTCHAQPSDIMIEIDAHMAFGTGTHETTRMICRQLLNMPLEGKRVLDCGCGTGILGICALKLGAASCVGYDIDEWSADNTRHNAVINRVDDRLEALCGDASVLGGYAPEFDVVLANINRNILLQDMERFVSVMAPGATLILSGFYQSDCQMLEEKALTLGLHPTFVTTDGDWACCKMIYHPHKNWANE